MSASLKRFLKKYGRFPKKGELKRMNKRRRDHPKKQRRSKHKKHSQTRRSSRRSGSRGWIFR